VHLRDRQDVEPNKDFCWVQPINEDKFLKSFSHAPPLQSIGSKSMPRKPLVREEHQDVTGCCKATVELEGVDDHKLPQVPDTFMVRVKLLFRQSQENSSSS